MVGYTLRKALQYALVLFVAVTVNFALPRLAPGDPLDYLLGEQAFQLRPEQRRQILAQFELDRRRDLSDILTEVAEGRAELIHFG